MTTTQMLCRLSAALLLGGSVLLLSACNNQLPAPAPVPGQPLTYAQQYELKKARYQADLDSRHQDHNCPSKRCL